MIPSHRPPGVARMANEQRDRAQQIRRIARLTMRMSELRSKDTPQVFVRSGLTVPQMRVLFVIARERRVRPGLISTATGIAPPNVTALLSRLEERDIIIRRPDPDDGRATMVELTEEGRRIARDLVNAGQQDFADAVILLTDDELEALERGLGALIHAMEQRLAEHSAGPEVRAGG